MLGSKKMPRRSLVLRSRRSLKGISCCSISFILGSFPGRGEIFFRGNFFLRARLRRFCARRPIGDNAGAPFDVIADLHQQLGIAGQPEVGAGTEAHEPDAFAAGDAVARFLPADHAAGNQPGDLLEGDFARVGGEGDYVLLVVSGSGLAHGCGEFAGAILQVGDRAGGGRTIDMHVPDGEEDGDALAGTSGVLFVGDDHDAAVGGGDYSASISGNDAVGIAEEVKDEGGEAKENYAGDGPAQKQGGSAERERGQPEVVAFLDHASRQYHSKGARGSGEASRARSATTQFWENSAIANGSGRVGYGRQSAPFHPCSRASFS